MEIRKIEENNKESFMSLKGIAKIEDFDGKTYKMIKEGWKKTRLKTTE